MPFGRVSPLASLESPLALSPSLCRAGTNHDSSRSRRARLTVTSDHGPHALKSRVEIQNFWVFASWFRSPLPTANLAVWKKKATTPHSPPRTVTMQLRNGIQTFDAYRPTFDPNLDIATVVFSHVQCVKTRLNLALVSKLWRDASKPAAAYPREFDFDAFPDMDADAQDTRVTGLLDNDEALSLPYERVVGLLGEAAEHVCNYAAMRGSVRAAEVGAREQPCLEYIHVLCAALMDTCPLSSTCTRTGALGTRHVLFRSRIMGTCPLSSTCTRTGALGTRTRAFTQPKRGTCPFSSTCTRTGALGPRASCWYAAERGHLPVLKYLHENGCPWDEDTCWYAAYKERWDCLQYAVDNKCPGVEETRQEAREAPTMKWEQ